MASFELRTLGEAIRERQGVLRLAVPDRSSERTIRRLVHEVRRTIHLRRRRSKSIASIAMMAAIVLTAVALLAERAPLRLSVGMAQVPAAETEWIRAGGREIIPLRFSDGTVIELMPDTRVRVAHLGPYGARLNLETGQLRARLTSSKGHEWAISAGPYTVSAVGTDFDVSWLPEAGLAEIDVWRGSAKIAGPLLADEQLLTGHQKLALSLSDRCATITESASSDF
ncbi:MAG TPA: FecR family protein [Polyangiaceae bacterium]